MWLQNCNCAFVQNCYHLQEFIVTRFFRIVLLILQWYRHCSEAGLISSSDNDRACGLHDLMSYVAYKRVCAVV